MDPLCNETAFPALTAAEILHVEPMGERINFLDGAVVFRAGDADLDLFIVEQGQLEILNPTDGDRQVALHGVGQFAGDIDLLTGRPAVVTAIARGATRLLRIPSERVREVLLRLPQISEKLLRAFQERRRLLSLLGNVGLRLYGPADCKETNVIREFLDKNFVPFTWIDTNLADSPAPPDTGDSRAPVEDCGGGKVLNAPSLRELARCAGLWRECPVGTVDLAIVGAGPAGMSAAVYAASEGLSTLVLDALGPGGQAASSSKIENFIGFPSGLSGTELATRAVIQMLKFGARIITPVQVERLETCEDGSENHRLHLDCGSIVTARNVLIATGLEWRHLTALGTEKYENIGIYYACTTTETLSHQGTDVAVVGGGNSAGQAAMFLAEQCDHTVHLLVRGAGLEASMSRYLIERIAATPNIRLHTGTEVTRIIEDGRLRAVEVAGPDSESSVLPIGALYVFIGAQPHIGWLPPQVARDVKGYLLTGADAAATGKWPLTYRAPCPLETTIPRLFAAGDVRWSSTKRVGFAVGDGALAVACVHSLEGPRVAVEPARML